MTKNTKMIKKITLILGHKFLNLKILNNRKLKLQIEIFRINKQKTCIYQFRKITLKNYQIISKNHETEYEQTRTLYKP